jgi:hypothetical protein
MLLPDLVRSIGGTVTLEDSTAEQGCNYAHLSGAPSAMSFMVSGDTVLRVDVDATGVTTAEGLGVGSTEAALLERYGGRARVEPHPYGGQEEHYVVVSTPGDTLHRMTFETNGKTVLSFRVGRGSAVDLIEGCS